MVDFSMLFFCRGGWFLFYKIHGAAGSLLSIFYNIIRVRTQSKVMENGVISALKGELRRNILLCKYNAKLDAHAYAPFVHFRTDVISKVAFEDNYKYKRLKDFRDKLEWYSLSLVHVNELIDDYRLLIPLTEKQGPNERDNLRNSIASICKGNKIEGIGPEGFIILDNFMESLSKYLDKI